MIVVKQLILEFSQTARSLRSEKSKLRLFNTHLFPGQNQQQEGADRNPNLSIKGILGSAIERFDLKMLLDPFEKLFHVPALSVELCNGESFVSEMVGEESINIDGTVQDFV